jgi:chromosome segregation ATPase
MGPTAEARDYHPGSTHQNQPDNSQALRKKVKKRRQSNRQMREEMTNLQEQLANAQQTIDRKDQMIKSLFESNDEKNYQIFLLQRENNSFRQHHTKLEEKLNQYIVENDRLRKKPKKPSKLKSRSNVRKLQDQVQATQHSQSSISREAAQRQSKRPVSKEAPKTLQLFPISDNAGCSKKSNLRI